MINTLNELKRRSVALGLCGEYKGLWDECRSVKELYDLATDINGIEYLCDAVTFGWGGSFGTEYIKERFGDYINGAYKRDRDGYTSSLYCGYEGFVIARSTVLCLLDCKGTVVVPPDAYTTVLVGAGTDVRIVCMGRISELVIFGDAKVRCSKEAEKTRTITESAWKRA